MSSVTISYRGITTNTCKLRLFQGNYFLDIIYFYAVLQKKNTKNTRVSVLKIYEYSIF